MSEALRPRYKFTLAGPAAEIRQRIQVFLHNPSHNTLKLTEHSVSNHLIISLPRDTRHFWSPTLDVNLEELPDTKTTLRVLIGPAPQVWTMFMFIYSIAGLFTLAGAVLGYAQFLLDKTAWAFWLTPLGMVLGSTFYFIGLAGKHRAENEMQQLKQSLERALGQALFNGEEIPQPAKSS